MYDNVTQLTNQLSTEQDPGERYRLHSMITAMNTQSEALVQRAAEGINSEHDPAKSAAEIEKIKTVLRSHPEIDVSNPSNWAHQKLMINVLKNSPGPTYGMADPTWGDKGEPTLAPDSEQPGTLSRLVNYLPQLIGANVPTLTNDKYIVRDRLGRGYYQKLNQEERNTAPRTPMFLRSADPRIKFRQDMVSPL